MNIPSTHRLIQLRFFVGLSEKDAAGGYGYIARDRFAILDLWSNLAF